ncbi:MAG: response regulator [Neisseriaceae bacterium]|nr:MAG: response regulator [Neisseriaceae bacterium]
MLSAIILDDEILAQERLKLLLHDNHVIVLEMFTNAKRALQWLQYHQTDIIFVDIRLPEISGLEFVQQFKQFNTQDTAIIFSTAYDEFAVDAFSLNAKDYLLKPVCANRLKETLRRILKYKNNTDNSHFHYFTIQLKNEWIKIPWQKVTYLQAEDKSVFLLTDNNERYELPKTLTYWEEQLKNKVVRVHRNTLVMKHMLESLTKIEHNGNNRWHAKIINSNTLLPISRRQLGYVQQQFCEE